MALADAGGWWPLCCLDCWSSAFRLLRLRSAIGHCQAKDRLKAELQQSKGYDRNLSSRKAVLAAIDYIHRNPIRRGLIDEVTHWKWSSTRWYASDRQIVDPDLPTIHGLPPEFFD